jgi:hypothetical protein
VSLRLIYLLYVRIVGRRVPAVLSGSPKRPSVHTPVSCWAYLGGRGGLVMPYARNSIDGTRVYFQDDGGGGAPFVFYGARLG